MYIMADADIRFFIGLASLAGLKWSLSYILHKIPDPRAHLELVGWVSRLTVYPVKSLRGVNTDRGDIDEMGLLSVDRMQDRYMMVIKQNGEFVTGRQIPKMVLVTPSIHGDLIHLDAPRMTTLKIPKTVTNAKTIVCNVWGHALPGVDVGPEAAEWISEVLAKPGLRLVATTIYMQKREVWKGNHIFNKLAPEGTRISYQDLSPFHLISEETVDELNKRLTTPVSTDNFRPNIVVSGCKANDEFDWQEIYIGNVNFLQLYPCERCTFPSVDPKTGVRDDKYEPITALKKYMPNGVGKIGPALGILLKAESRGTVHVDDPVYVLRKSAIRNFLF